MARLFGKEYHEHSNTWYFKSSIKDLDKDGLEFRKYLNEKGDVVFRFDASPKTKAYFTAEVEIIYDKTKNKILEHNCSLCKDENCSHFLTIVNYGYKYLTTNIVDDFTIQTYQSKILSYNEYWQRLMLNSRILISGIYDNKSDKIRFYFEGYDRFDIRLIAMYIAGKELKEEEQNKISIIKKQISVFSEGELGLLKTLNDFKCSFSRKSAFFSIYRKDMIHLFPLIKSLNKVYIKETGDLLTFSSEEYRVNFQVSKADNKDFILRLNPGESISAFYCGNTTYILRKNVVFSISLPFSSEICEIILRDGYRLKEQDLVYLNSVVSRQLSLIRCYLDFDEDIIIPQVYDNTPIVTFQLSKENEAIIMTGLLDYGNDVSIPLSVIRYPTELVRFDQNKEIVWFYIPPQIRYQIFSFFDLLPQADISELETKSRLTFVGENNIDVLKKTIFEKALPGWNIELTDDLKKEFVYKVELKPVISAKNSDEIDWFNYDVNYNYKDISFSHDELKKFFKSKEKFLKLEDGRLLFFTNKEAFTEVDNFLEKSVKEKDDSYKMAIYNIPFLYQITAVTQGLKMRGDSFLDEIYESIRTRHLPEREKVPSMLRPIMRSYQKAGFQWMRMLREYRFGGILADDMGLGKTIQALSVLSSLPSDSISVVICPKTLLFNWAAEIEKFNPSLSFILYEGSKEERKNLLKNIRVNILLASYSIIQNDLDDLQKINFDYVILDEAQHIKNNKALRTKAIKKLKSNYRLALTGTPMENNPTEVWSIFDFLMPGYLPSINKFKKEYILSDNEGRNKREDLARLLSPFILRRKKHDVLIELPDKQEQIVYCKMNKLQESMYLEILDNVKKQLLPQLNSNALPNYMHILTTLMRLRQICNHPALVDKNIKTDFDNSGKTELLKEIFSEAISSGRKLLIFSQFVEMLKIVKTILIDMKVPYEYLDGSTKNREKHVNNFNNNNNIRAFLISLKTGGFGLNLTAADTVVLIDPWWNPMGEKQAIDRAHRIGQTKKVMVYKIITKGTVEEKIVALQKNKELLFEQLIEGSQNILRSLDSEQIKELFEY